VTINGTFDPSPAELETATVRFDVADAGATGGTGDDEGPLVTSVDTSETTASGQSIPHGETVTLTATATDFQRGGVDIYAVEWRSNRTAPGGTFAPVDGEYDSVDESVTTTVDTNGWDIGAHNLSVRARDANGNWGPVQSYTVVLTSGSTDPPGAVAYDDANDNGRYDSGETTYTKTELESGLDDPDVNLVVPSDVGTLDLGRNTLSTRSMRIRTDIDTRGGGVQLLAEETIDIAGQTVVVRGGDIEISAGEGGSGRLIATGATIDTNRELRLRSNGDLSIDAATVRSGSSRNIETTLGTDGATLFVDGATISDRDDTIEYAPGGVTVDGTPTQGSVTAA
jgi:hypothetical protein